MLEFHHLLYVSAALFSIGAYGVLTCRNILVILMSIEIMLSGISLSLTVFSRTFGNSAGQVFVLFVIAVAAAEAAIGLAILLSFYKQTHSVKTDSAASMKG
jgi:NADH-quinone oxidoreductase subunit K